jgi:glycerol-3-phosphate acyltransferase PlsY
MVQVAPVWPWIMIAYLCGSIPFGLLIGRMVKGVDLRKHGSGNIGATNVFRVVGKKWGITALLLDTLKGSLAIWMPYLIAGQSASVQFNLLLGATAILGHSFSVWLKFKGGKGVATSLGVFLCIVPVPTLISFLVFALVFTVTRIISVSSLIAALVFPINIFLLCRYADGFSWLLTISLVLLAFILYTHRSNIVRLVNGEEKRLF